MHRLRGATLPLILSALTVLLPGPPALAGPLGTTTAAAAPQPVKPPPGFARSCLRYAWLCEDRPATGAGVTGAARLDLARRINARVNADIRPLTDPENYGVAEYWTLPQNGSGDCEDYALEKYRRLLEAGVDSRDLRIAVVLDRNRNNHVVLVLGDDSGDLVLDSLTSRILPWNQTGYTFLAAQMAEGKSRWEIVAGQPRDSTMLARR